MRRTFAFLLAASLSLPAGAYQLVEMNGSRDADIRVAGPSNVTPPARSTLVDRANNDIEAVDPAEPAAHDLRTWALAAAGVLVLVLGSRQRGRHTRIVRFPARRR